jgi:GNAT superfamily N-acetyltransferase
MLIQWRAPVPDAAVDDLHAVAFERADDGFDWSQQCQHSLGWVTATDADRLVGFANVAWDGNAHAFLLDVAVVPNLRRQGVGRRVVERAFTEARRAGCQWLHVDYERQHENFYRACGFEPTPAGLHWLQLGPR